MELKQNVPFKMGYQLLNHYKYITISSNSKYWSLENFYKTCSSAKYIAEKIIIDELIENGGNISSYYIMGGNSSTFSCAYKICKGEKEWLIYHTYAHRYIVECSRYKD